jgi:zona occludens toxin
MPTKIYTGTPGAGKTLGAIEECCKIVGVDPRKYATAEALSDALRKRTDPRLIFVCNVKGLLPGIFDTLEDPLDWQDCPDGSVILVDEAWEFFGTHISEAKRDDRILQVAKHRHRGFSFIFTTQHPSQLVPHIRNLVDEHVHVSRKFGSDITERFTWASVCDDPNSIPQRKRGSGGIPWTFPKSVFGLYQSATVHTMKRKIPLRVLALPLLAVLGIALLAFGGWRLMKFATPAAEAHTAPAAQRSEQQGTGVTQPSPAAKQDRTTAYTAEEWRDQQAMYAQKHQPRIDTHPWSAPIFDNRAAVAEPRLLCYVSYRDDEVDGKCKCFTEQATKYFISDESCRQVAENGEPYNPYRRPGRILTTDSGAPESRVGGGSPTTGGAPVVHRAAVSQSAGASISAPSGQGGAVISAGDTPTGPKSAE